MPPPGATRRWAELDRDGSFQTQRGCVLHPGGTSLALAALTQHPMAAAALHQGHTEPSPAHYTSPHNRLAAGKSKVGFPMRSLVDFCGCWTSMLGVFPPASIILSFWEIAGPQGLPVGAHACPSLISELHLALRSPSRRQPGLPRREGSGGGGGEKKLKHIKGVNKRLI